MVNITELLNDFRNELLREDKSENTVASYISDINSFLSWYEGSTSEGIEKLIALDLKDYRSYLLGNRSAKVATVNRKVASINKFMDWLHNEGHLQKSLKLKQVKQNTPQEFKGLSEREVKTLRKEVHRNGNKRDILIIELLLNTGLRVSELCNIRIGDIEASERKGRIKVMGKGMKERVLQLNKEVREAIEEYLQVRPKMDCDCLFVGQRGGLTRNGVFKSIKKYADRIGIEVSPHTLRHTLARKLLESGSDITTVQGILGHERLETTAIYTKTTQDKMDRDLEGLNW
ncbi:MAG TPA: recombinase XerC [Desulfosporosinus sp.]|nr:recombinase XerC [Desulfosporosinus sp.]